MSDHIFDSNTAAALLRQPLAKNEVILGVDHKLDCIFDLDDATKVVRMGSYITSIGKNLKVYDAADTGMFLCTPAVFDALDAVTKDGNCSLSDGMQHMASNRKLRASISRMQSGRISILRKCSASRRCNFRHATPI